MPQYAPAPLSLKEWVRYVLLPRPLRLRRRRNKMLVREAELKLVPSLLRPGLMGIDVGSSIGVYAAEMARATDRVVAFEPNPRPHGIFKRVGPAKAQLHQVALGEENGTLEFFIPHKRRGGKVVSNDDLGGLGRDKFAEDYFTLQVEVKRLDEYGFTRVGLIKIDTEGFEQEVLRGGLETIATSKPNLIVEIESRHRGVPVAETFAFIQSLGYGGFFFSEQKLHALSRFDPERHGVEESPEYVSNFIFLPEG